MLTCLQLKHLGVHLHVLDTRDTYANSIINEVLLGTKLIVSDDICS